MKQLILSILLIFCLVMGTKAQSSPRPNQERLKAIKVGMITEKLQLSAQQAKEFWPIYDEYSANKMALNKGIREKMHKNRGTEMSPEEHLKMQDEVLALQAKELDLVKNYRPRFLKVISAKQYSELQVAEREFNQMLLKELQNRRGVKRD